MEQMTRAAEFCYLAELQGRSPKFILAYDATRVWWTDDQEMGVRFTEEGRRVVSRLPLDQKTVGFRKILVG